jgi:hypothetical protein
MVKAFRRCHNSGVRRTVLLLLSVAALAAAADTLEVFGLKWTVPAASDWKVDAESGTPVLRLVQNRGPLPGPRRPIQFALAGEGYTNGVQVEADVMPLGKSLLIVFAYRDEAHFDYAHLSTDTGEQQPVHNGIFHVYGGERVRISSPRGPAAFPANQRWHHAVLTHDVASGKVGVTVDGVAIPALQAVDLSLGPGQAGIGSFDETAVFRNVRITAR